MGDGPEKSKASNGPSEFISYVVSGILPVWTERPRVGRLQLEGGLTQTKQWKGKESERGGS